MIIVYIYQISDNRFILIEYSHQYPLEVKIIREKSIYLHCLGERASIQWVWLVYLFSKFCKLKSIIAKNMDHTSFWTGMPPLYEKLFVKSEKLTLII